jgi:hypothetical protein
MKEIATAVLAVFIKIFSNDPVPLPLEKVFVTPTPIVVAEEKKSDVFNTASGKILPGKVSVKALDNSPVLEKPLLPTATPHVKIHSDPTVTPTPHPKVIDPPIIIDPPFPDLPVEHTPIKPTIEVPPPYFSESY